MNIKNSDSGCDYKWNYTYGLFYDSNLNGKIDNCAAANDVERDTEARLFWDRDSFDKDWPELPDFSKAFERGEEVTIWTVTFYVPDIDAVYVWWWLTFIILAAYIVLQLMEIGIISELLMFGASFTSFMAFYLETDEIFSIGDETYLPLMAIFCFIAGIVGIVLNNKEKSKK